MCPTDESDLTQPPKPHDPRYFAMLNNAVAVAGNEDYEGGVPEDAIAYYRYLLNLDRADCPIPLNLSDEQEAKLKAGFENFLLLDIPEDGIESLIRDIKAMCEKNDACYLASGWFGEPGHTAALKIRKLSDGRYTFSLINHGDGMQYHRTLSRSGTKEKRCYQSEEYAIDLDSEAGKELLLKLAELQKPTADFYAQDKKINAFSADDLYGLLSVYGKRLDSIENLREKNVTPQRTGSCTVTNIHAVARDILIDNGADFKTRKRYHFVIKLRSILVAYDEYQKGNYPRESLEWAMREFAVRVNKQYKDILRPEEVIYCGELQTKINTRLSADKAKDIEKKCEKKPFPSLTGDLPPIDKEMMPIKKERVKEAEAKIKKTKTDVTTEVERITPANVAGLIEKYNGLISSRLYSVDEICDFVNRLPACSGEASDPFWDKIPNKAVDKIIEHLSTYIRRFPKNDAVLAQSPASYFAAALKVYDIVAQLAQGHKKFKLGETYTFGLDDVYSDQSFFSDPSDFYTVKTVVKNFSKRSQGKKRVFTNAVAYPFATKDETIRFLIRVQLNDNQRRKLAKAFLAQKNESSRAVSDEELFEHMNMELCRWHTEEAPFGLNPALAHVFEVAATAHNLGKHQPRYTEKRGVARWFFMSNEFDRQVMRQEFSQVIDEDLHLPKIQSSKTVFQDFSENTCYHPRESLEALREEFHNSERVAKRPYQIYPSGSVNPDSTPWQVDEQHKQLFEEINADLRHIECSPELQIVRLLAWLKHNAGKIQFPQIRKYIFDVLFQFGKLDSALANNHEAVLLNLSGSLEAMIRFCWAENINNVEILNWIGEIAYHTRQYIETAAAIYGFSLTGYSLPSYRELFIEKIITLDDPNAKSRLASHVVRSFENTEALSLEDCCTALVFRVLANLGDYHPLSEEVWQRLKTKVTQKANEDPSAFVNALSARMQRELGFPKLTWQLKNDTLIATNKQFIVDLNSGVLQDKNAATIKECTVKLIAENELVFDRLGLSKESITIDYLSNESPYKECKSRDGVWGFKAGAIHLRGKVNFLVQSCYQYLNIQGVSHKFVLLAGDLVQRAKPFERVKENTSFLDLLSSSEVFKNARYEYWQCADDEKILFVKQRGGDVAFIMGGDDFPIREMKQNEKGHWQPTGRLLLNLVNPTTTLEKAWAERLTPIFGVENVRVLAKLNEERTAYTIESIEHLALGLSFYVKAKEELSCHEVPRFVLSDVKGLPVLNGFSHIILLENDKKEKKVIVPAFSLAAGKKNNAFNTENIVSTAEFCNGSIPYYTYTLDKRGELVPPSPSEEASLYLALLYRSLGDYKRAIHYLARAKSRNPLTKAQLNIAMQVMQRKVISPLGAAFDLKLACFIKEQREKWAREDPFAETVEVSDDWKKWVSAQYRFYKSTVSAYKEDVSILPSYCRLSAAEIEMLSTEWAMSTGVMSKAVLNARLNKCSTLPDAIMAADDDAAQSSYWEEEVTRWRQFNVESSRWDPDKMRVLEPTWMSHLSPTPTALRLNATQEGLSSDKYLFYNFKRLIEEAISDDPLRLDKLRRELFSLLQNDSDPEKMTYALIAILSFAMKYSQFVKEADRSGTHEQIIINVGNELGKHRDELSIERVFFYENKPQDVELIYEGSIPSDFEPAAVSFSIGDMAYEKVCQHPLGDLSKKYFNQETTPLAATPFRLDGSELKDATRIERKLFEQYKKKHEINQQRKNSVYAAKENADLSQIRKKVKSQQEADEQASSKLYDRLLKFANQTPVDDPHASENEHAWAYNLLAARASEGRPPLTLTDLLSAMLQQNPQVLVERNPFLSQNDVNTLFANLADYMLLQSRIAQADSVNALIDEHAEMSELTAYEQQQLASTLDKARAYDVTQYPEFLMYEYATRKLLRDDQVNSLRKLIELIERESTDAQAMHHALFQFAAGGGKTAVLIPILAQRFARKGFLPVILNTSELYDIGLHEIPKNLKNSFDQNLEIIERELDYEWTEAKLLKLYDDLVKWRNEGKCLLLKPVTWHSINIAVKNGFRYNDQIITTAGQKVLNFFKKHCVKLEDECHIVSDPLMQCIKTTGGYTEKIPAAQLDLLLRFYDFLMGYEMGAEAIAQLAGIASKRTRPITAEEQIELQQHLAKTICQAPLFESLDKADLLAYLTKADRERPEWLIYLRNADKELANSVVLARAFIKSHLPHILTLQYGKDYGHSIHKNDLTCAPKHEGQDVTSHFADPALVAALTIQLYHQRGLTTEHCQQLFNVLIEKHHAECARNKDETKPTQAETWLLENIPENYSFSNMADLSDGLKNNLANDPHFLKDPAVVKRFLVDFALVQIEMTTTRQTSTASELQAGFKRSILFSATPGLLELYPAFLDDDNFFEETFEAQVIDVLLQQQNSGLCTLDAMQTPQDFFRQIPDDLLAKMGTLIDRGAILTDFPAADVIKTYLGLEKQQGAKQTSAFFAEKRLQLKSKAGVKEVSIDGAGLLEELKAQGLQPETFLLFLFLDLSKTTGTDIKRPYHDHAGLTVGKTQTLTDTIQAAMRERQLLDKDAQSVTWIMFNALYREIYKNDPSDTFDPTHLFYWMLKNEATTIESKIINRAYQGIHQAIIEVVKAELLKNPDDSMRWKLEDRQYWSPFFMYEAETVEKATQTVLNDYVESLLTDFKLEKENIPSHIEKRIEKIITQTSALIETLQDPPKIQLNNEVQQEQQAFAEQRKEEQQRQRMKTKFDSEKDFVFALEHYSKETDDLSIVFDRDVSADGKRYQQLVLPDCEQIKSPALFFHPAHFSALEQKGAEKEETLEQLKPIKMLLIKMLPSNELQYTALTAAGAEYFTHVIQGLSLQQDEASYVLMSTEDDVLLTSNNTSIQTCQRVIQGEDCQAMLTYAQLLNGKITDPEKVAAFIKSQDWSKEDFGKIANAVARIHVSPDPVDLLNNPSLELLCGWRAASASKAAAHRRYQPRKAKTKSMPSHALHPRYEGLENQPNLANVELRHPKTALENYVLGKDPEPVAFKTAEEFALEQQANKPIRGVSGKMSQAEKLAVRQLKMRVKQALNSDRPFEARKHAMEVQQKNFAKFHLLLSGIEKKLQELPIEPDPTLKEEALRAVNNAYLEYSVGQSISTCCEKLTAQLEFLEEHAPKVSKAHSWPYFFSSDPSSLIETCKKEIDRSGLLGPRLSEVVPRKSG